MRGVTETEDDDDHVDDQMNDSIACAESRNET